MIFEHGDSKTFVFYTRRFFFKGQLLSEIATDDENILGCESGDWVLPIYEKNRVRKSPETGPFTALLLHNQNNVLTESDPRI